MGLSEGGHNSTERERATRLERRAQAAIQKAAAQSSSAPTAASGHLVLGVPIGGDLPGRMAAGLPILPLSSDAT
jgi:hypothetical protein